jgi:hypothetical protein
LKWILLLSFNKITIPYDQFDDFISASDEDETPDIKEDDEARIFLIAPVLVKGIHANWKGYYAGKPIDFKVCDKQFLEQIYSHDIRFSNGTYIDCKLQITTTVKEEPRRETIKNEVVEINSWGDDENFVKPIKKRIRWEKESKQNKLFSDEDYNKMSEELEEE